MATDSDSSKAAGPRPWWLRWSTLAPVAALVVLVFVFGSEPPLIIVIVVALLLAGSVLAAVQHAEVLAHRVGEPLGSLVLAVAVTVIEVGLILTLMTSGGEDASTLARDTVFAAVMITMNGIVGLSVLAGAIRFGTASFNSEGTGAALATVATLATMTMVLPTFTKAAGPRFSPPQLAFAAVMSVLLYALFIVTQTVRHRSFFLPVAHDGPATEDEHADPPTNRETLIALVLLLVSLLTVVGLAKVESPSIEHGVEAAGLPESFVGVIIALLVLAPETLAAVRAAGRNQLQVSLNLGYGSAMASIGLTIPAIAVAEIWFAGPLDLGLGPVQIALLVLTVAVSTLTVIPGRATRLQGGVHLILLAAFVFLAAVP